MTPDQLIELGFDNSSKDRRKIKVACSQCEVMIINGMPTHESGCPRTKHECRGCNNIVPRGVRYCEDCR